MENVTPREIKVTNQFVIALITSIADVNPEIEKIDYEIVNSVINQFWSYVKSVENDEQTLEILFDGLSTISILDREAILIHLNNSLYLRNNQIFTNIVSPENTKLKLIKYSSLKAQVKKLLTEIIGKDFSSVISVGGAIRFYSVIKKNNQDTIDANLFTSVYVNEDYINILRKQLLNFDFDQELSNIIPDIKIH